jgi:hypothetical protein
VTGSSSSTWRAGPADRLAFLRASPIIASRRPLGRIVHSGGSCIGFLISEVPSLVFDDDDPVPSQRWKRVTIQP